MEYELAKKLKDAGFPEDKMNGEEVCQWLEKERKKCLQLPTLSELIEAVKTSGGYFAFELQWNRNPRIAGIEWTAQIRSHADSPCTDGSTPEEAVSMLWLSLNKK